MRPRLVSRIRAPYGGGFTIRHPMTGFELYGSHFDMLYNRYVDYNKANSLPVGLDDEQVIMDLVCAKYPQECEVSMRSIRPRTSLNFWDAVRGTTAVFIHKGKGSPLVSQDEANRRAQICRNCPFNVQMTMPCARCFSALENVVTHVVAGSNSTPHDDQLRSCGICGCWTRAIVWMPLESQCHAVTDEMREEFKFAVESLNCWKTC